MATMEDRHDAFNRWLLHDRGATALVPPGPLGGPADGPGAMQREVWSVHELLHSLWEDASVLSRAACMRLGLPPESTVAHAVRMIAILCGDDTFPADTHGDVVEHLGCLPPDEVMAYWEAVDAGLTAHQAR